MKQTLADALAARGYTTLTPVQEAVTNPDLASKDLLVSAQTGSGKTVGFGLAIADTILGDGDTFDAPAQPLALVIAPTRELALQVNRELDWLYANAGVAMASCVGGMDMRQERRRLEKGAHIVVATPGRLRDHIDRGSLDMSDIRAIVLDEADEMLDLGFREDLEFILGSAPEDRRTLLFSATVPRAIADLARQFQKDAERVVTTGESRQHSDISYQAMEVADRDVEHAIMNMLRFHDAPNAIVFGNTRATVNRLTTRLSNRGFAVVALSGELTQSERSHALQAMRDGRARVCVATDVAARGIDLPNLDLVIHAELPTSSETLLHRSGRTGRAGRKGISAMIATPKSRKKAERLLKWAKLQAEWVSPPNTDEILARDEERMLEAPVWTDEVDEADTAVAARLTEKFSHEQIANAFWQLYKAKLSAPEDIGAPSSAPAGPSARESFGPSTWFTMSVGREQRAEPRWLMPMLCRAGNLSKEDIGAIRVQQNETFIEIKDSAVATLVAAAGDTKELEEGIFVRQLDGVPDFGPAPRRGEGRPDRRDDRRDDRRPAPHRGQKPRRSFDDAEGGAPAREDRPAYKKRDNDGEKRPFGDRDKKPYGDREKRPYKGDGEKRPYKGDGEKRPYKGGDKRPYKSDGDKRPYKGGGEKRPYGEGKPRKFNDDGPRKPYARKDGDGGFKPKGKPRGDAPEKPRAEKPKPDFTRTDQRMGGRPLRGGDVKKGGGKPKGPRTEGGKPSGKPSGKYAFRSEGFKTRAPRGGDARPKRRDS